MRFLVHVHIYYPQFWEELKLCVVNLKKTGKCDLFVTMPEECRFLFEDIQAFDDGAKILFFENKGFDVGPFIEILNRVDLDTYDYVVKLHTKRDIKEYSFMFNGYNFSGSKWRDYLLSFCSTDENWQKSLKMLDVFDVGMVADRHVILEDERLNAHELSVWDMLRQKLGIASGTKRIFVAGTMFAAKASVFKVFQKVFSMADFEQPVRDNNMLLPHYLERLFGYVVYSSGYRIASFDGEKSSKYWGLLQQIKRFFFYHKITEDKEIVKICKLPLWHKRHNKVEG